MLFLKDNNSTEQKNIGYLIKICIEIITLLLITFWSGSAAGLEFDQDGEDDSYQSDPRKDEDWKIQRRKGFLKDRESKAQQAKQVKLSKTARRNSKEPMFSSNSLNNSKQAEKSNEENTFDFLDDIITKGTPVVPMPGTSKTQSTMPNLDSSKVLNWFDQMSTNI